MKDTPNKIYLNISFDPTGEKDLSFKELDEVTWSQDRIETYDIEYVLASAPSAEMDKKQLAEKTERARFQVESGIDHSGVFFEEIHKPFTSENKLVECQQYSNTDTQLSLLWVDDKIEAFVIEARSAFNHVELVKGTTSAASSSIIATKPVWISVEDRLPEIGERCLIFGEEIGVSSMVLHLKSDASWYDNNGREFLHKRYIQFWHPLPEPPQSTF